MIAQELHEIQHRRGYLPREELEALSERLKVPLRRLHEVASCFPHYRLTPPPPVEVKVCRDMACHILGGPRFRQGLESLAAEVGGDQIAVGGVSCLGRCDSAPAVSINDKVYWGKSLGEVRTLVRLAMVRGEGAEAGLPPQRSERTPLPWRIDPYLDGAREPYAATRAFAADPDVKGLLAKLEAANLRGMGGAGEPAFRKWNDVREARGDEKYVVCNADESEPSTFKDREIMLRAPHLVVEGVILAGMIVGATKGIIYVRHEYDEAIEALREEIARAGLMGAFGVGNWFPVEVFVSPGGYICGEQSALIEAIEDRRAEPRNKPPTLATNGLYDKPTLVNNVETLAWTPSIALNGGEWYRDNGINGGQGMRLFSVCGDLARPGVHEVPIGITLGELIDLCGGILGDKPLGAVAPSGPSGGLLPALIPVETFPKGFEKRVPEDWARACLPPGARHVDVRDLRLDIDFFRALDLMLGAGLVVYNDRRDPLDLAVNASEFFRNESCGKCVPCRLGSQRIVEIGEGLRTESHAAGASATLSAIGSQAGLATRTVERRLPPSRESLEKGEAVVNELNEVLKITSICGLGAVAGGPLASYFRYFRPEGTD